MWRFDPATLDLIWAESIETMGGEDGVSLDFGTSGDLVVDFGDATNAESIVDLGQRILDGTA